MKATKDDWVKMEKRAAAGVGGALHENFRPSLLMMDEASDNSSSPIMIVNGERTVQCMYMYSSNVRMFMMCPHWSVVVGTNHF